MAIDAPITPHIYLPNALQNNLIISQIVTKIYYMPSKLAAMASPASGAINVSYKVMIN